MNSDVKMRVLLLVFLAGCASPAKSTSVCLLLEQAAYEKGFREGKEHQEKIDDCIYLHVRATDPSFPVELQNAYFVRWKMRGCK